MAQPESKNKLKMILKIKEKNQGKKECVYLYKKNTESLLYSSNQHIVNQLYLNKKNFFK